MKKSDLCGKQFGRLTALESKSKVEGSRERIFWKCICDCGKITEVKADALKDGRTKSCGCLRKEVIGQRSLKHGGSIGYRASKEYKAWQHAKSRCYNPNDRKYRNYGARGIKMCKGWKHSFSKFLKDMGKCARGLTLDRINVDGNYEPKNCHWTTTFIQARHRTDNVYLTFGGVTKIEADWARAFGIDKRKLNAWLKKGLTIEDIARRIGYA